jgi:NAD(P)-dependent dehydrogenase (short-subunit alcohol dehydrogenase family)
MPSPLFDLTGKVAFVTGGSKGLGLAMARGFAEAGANVVVSSRHADELQQAVARITEGTGAKAQWFVADMTSRAAVAELAQSALDAFGRIDILVNNAGSNVPQTVEEMTDAQWDEIVELNLSSCMSLSRALIPQMKSRKWGRIIHISSVMGFVSKPGRGAYSATKSGLIGLSRAMALELGPYNITVNCIAPGPFLTDLPMSVLSKAEQEAFAERTALGRWGNPRELAGPALFLASEAGSYVTGTTLTVDGGSLAKFG